MIKVLEGVEVHSIDKNEKYFIDVFSLGKTSINFDKEWKVCDSSDVDAILGFDGVFYKSKTENVEEMMEELSTSRADVLDSLTYILNNDLKSETYQIYFDKVNKDGTTIFNQKHDETFDWNGDNGESLKDTAIQFFVS